MNLRKNLRKKRRKKSGKDKAVKDKAILIEEVRCIIRSSTGNRARESLVVNFMNQTDLDQIQDNANIIDAFFIFAQK